MESTKGSSIGVGDLPGWRSLSSDEGIVVVRRIVLLSAGIVVCISVLMLARLHPFPRSAARAVIHSDDVGTVAQHHPPRRTHTEPGIRLPAPPRGQPVARVQDALRSRAEQGDAAAASLLAQDLHLCWWMSEQANVQKPDYRDVESATRAIRRRAALDRRGWEQAQEFIKQNGAYCKGLPAGEIDKLKASALPM